MSARSCSLACSVFFKGDPLVLEKAPHCAVARRRATLGQLGHYRPQGQIRLLGDPRQQPRALAGQPQRPPAAHRFGRRAATRPPALRPFHHTGHAHPKQRRRRPTGATAGHRRNYTFPQVLRIGSCHPMLAPNPSQHLESQNSTPENIFLIKILGYALMPAGSAYSGRPLRSPARETSWSCRRSRERQDPNGRAPQH